MDLSRGAWPKAAGAGGIGVGQAPCAMTPEWRGGEPLRRASRAHEAGY